MTELESWRTRLGLNNGRGAQFDLIPVDEDPNYERDWIVLDVSPAALPQLVEDVRILKEIHEELATIAPVPTNRRYALCYSVKASHPKTETSAGAHGPSSVAYTVFRPSLLTPSLEYEPGSRFYGADSSDFPNAVEHAEWRLAEAMGVIDKLLKSAVPNQAEHPTMFAAHEEAREFAQLVRSEYGDP